MESGDVIAYMECNFAFHFNIYRANERPILNRLIEALWLQFGPFMRMVYGRFGTATWSTSTASPAAIEPATPTPCAAPSPPDIADGKGLIGRQLGGG